MGTGESGRQSRHGCSKCWKKREGERERSTTLRLTFSLRHESTTIEYLDWIKRIEGAMRIAESSRVTTIIWPGRIERVLVFHCSCPCLPTIDSPKCAHLKPR